MPSEICPYNCKVFFVRKGTSQQYPTILWPHGVFFLLNILSNQYFASTIPSQPCNPVSKATALLFTAVGIAESPLITAVGHLRGGVFTCGNKDLGPQGPNLKITQNNAKITRNQNC